MTEDPPDPPNSLKATAGSEAEPHSGNDRAAALARVLLTNYKEMQPYLEFELGSRDAAQDALQETWEKLAGGPSVGPVRNPLSYLRRMALNLGRNRLRTRIRFITLDQPLIDELADRSPDPERSAFAADELAKVMDALGELPEQRRAIFLDKFRDGLSLDEIASLRGLHRRTVQKELDRAVRFLRMRLGREP
jgi:RNA polymerase sigma-70 factor (ECF subfamily)